MLKTLPSILFVLIAFPAMAQTSLPTGQWPAGVVEREGLPSERAFDYEFSDVDVDKIEGWLGWVGVELPVAASGSLSGWIWGQRGSQGWLNFRDYRVEGEIVSPELQLDEWVIDQASLRFGYASGNWYIGNLRGSIRAAGSDQNIGQATLSAQLSTTSPNLLEISGTIGRVDLGALLRALGVEIGLTNRNGTLMISGSAPLKSANSIAGWTAKAALRLDELDLQDVPAADLSASASLSNAEWTITSGEIDWVEQPFQLSGKGRLDASYPFALSLVGRQVSIDDLLLAFGQGELAEQLSGRFDLEVNAEGSSSLGLMRANLEVDSEELIYQGQKLEQISVGATYQPEAIELSIDSARLAGGQIAGRGNWSSVEQLSQRLPNSLRLTLDGLRLDELSGSLLPTPVSGVASGIVDLRSELRDGSSAWSSQGNLSVSALSAIQTAIGDAEVSWSKQIDSNELTAQLSTANETIDALLVAKLDHTDQNRIQNSSLVGYQASGNINGFRAEARLRSHTIPVQLSGGFALEGTSENWLRSGSVELQQAILALEDQRIELLDTALEITPDEFRLQRFRLMDARGRIAGSGILRRKETGSHQLNLRMVGVPLEPYAKVFIASPVQTVEGIATLEARLTKEASEADLYAAWKGHAWGNLDELQWNGLPIGQLSFEGRCDEALLAASLDGKLLGGQADLSIRLPISTLRGVNGTANTGDEQRTEIEARIADIELSRLRDIVSEIPLDRSRSVGELMPAQLSGRASGAMQLASEPLNGKSVWESHGNLTVAALSGFRSAVGDASVHWSKDLASSELTARLSAADGTIDATLVAQLDDDERSRIRNTSLVSYDATGHVDRFRAQVTMKTGLIPFQISGDFEVEGDPGNWLRRGSAELRQATMVVKERMIALQTAVVSFTPSEFRLQKFRLVDPRGRIAGSGVFRRDETGEHQLNLRIAGVQLEPYAKLLQPGPMQTIKGVTTIEARLIKEAAEPDIYSAWNGTVFGSLEELEWKGVPVGWLSFKGRIEDDSLAGSLDGNLLGGQAEVTGRLPLSTLTELREAEGPPLLSGENPRWEFQASLAGVELARMMAIVFDPRRATYFSGLALLEASGESTAENEIRIDSQLRIPILMHNRSQLVRDFVARASYTGGMLQVHQLTGGIAGGRVDARGSLLLKPLLSGQIRTSRTSSGEMLFDAQRIQLGGLMALLFPDYADQFAGIVSYRGSARFNRQLFVTGDAHAVDALVYGMPIQKGHAHLRLTFNSDGSLHHLSSENVSGTAIGGSFAGTVRMRGGSRYELFASAEVGRGKMDQLSKALGFEHIVGTGHFDGSVDLSSRDAASLAALMGQVQIEFEDGDAQSVPILPELSQFIPGLQLASTEITGGTMHARIGQGQLRISDLLLISDAFWIAGNGNASLTGGRLDLNAILQTGGSIEQQLSRSVVQKLALGILPQAAILAELGDLIRNRSIYFHVGGTSNHPVIQLRPAQTVGRAMIQSVRRQLLAVPTAAVTARSDRD